MQKFVGTWRLASGRAVESEAPESDSTLSLKFTSQPREAKSGGIVEYRAGHAFPEPRADQLTDPLQSEGVFEWIHFDAARSSGRCGTDFFGLGRLYYASLAGELFFSNDLFLLAGEAGLSDLNLPGCAMLLSIGECVGRHTLVQGIYRLEHGQVLEFDDSGHRVCTVWRLTPPASSIAPSQFVEQSNEIFESALGRTRAWAGPRVCLLSGGDDSRRIAAGLDRIGIDAELISQRYVGPGGFDEDTVPAQMIADCLSKPIDIEDCCSPAEIRADAEATLVQANGESLSHGWLQKTLRKSPPGSLIYDGLGGGDLMNGHYVREFPSHAKHYHRVEKMTEDLVANCAIKIRPAFRDAVSAAVLDALKNIPESPYRLTLFFLHNHTRRGTGSVAMLMRENRHTPYMPFVTRDVAEHSLALEYSEHLKHHYQAVATRLQNARLADVPRTRLGVPDQYKLNMSHLNRAASKAESSVGKTDYALNARLISARDNFSVALSEIVGSHEKQRWRRAPLRKLGLLAGIVSGGAGDSQSMRSAFSVEKRHSHG